MGSIEAGLLSSWSLHSVFSRFVMLVQLALISSVAIGSQVQFPELQETIVMEFKDAIVSKLTICTIVNLFLMLINRLLMLSRGSLMKHTCFTAARDT